MHCNFEFLCFAGWLIASTFLLCHGAQALHLSTTLDPDDKPNLGAMAQAVHRSLRSRRGVGLNLNNSGDLSYYADILLGGQKFTVLVDTGSSDLWVAGSVKNSNDTGLEGRIKYAVGGVEGPIKTANLQLAGYTVPDQAFLEVPPDEHHAEGMGIMGLGPGSGSFITDLLSSSRGAPTLYRVFLQNTSTPSYFTLLLGRSKDPTDTFSGSITIGEVLDKYSAVLQETRLNITKLPETLSDDQHLQVLLDPGGLIGPDGKPINFTSAVEQSVNKAQATVVLDSGFSLPQVPRLVADAIYGRFVGAEYVTVQGVGSTWILPCDQEVNVTFKFAGKNYPVHPLDMSMDPEALGMGKINNSRREKACIGTFQPFTYDRGALPNYDMVLGMAFMRNVYSLFNYGDFVGGSSTTTKRPYTQLLSITDAAQAHADFVTVRLGGVDIPTKGLTDPPTSNDGESSSGLSHMTYAMVAVAAVIGVLLLLAGFFVYRARRRRQR